MVLSSDTIYYKKGNYYRYLRMDGVTIAWSIRGLGGGNLSLPNQDLIQVNIKKHITDTGTIYVYVLFTSIELIASNALWLHAKSGFVVKEKRTELTSLLGISLEEWRRLKTTTDLDQDYHFALEESLQWWITNSTDPS